MSQKLIQSFFLLFYIHIGTHNPIPSTQLIYSYPNNRHSQVSACHCDFSDIIVQYKSWFVLMRHAFEKAAFCTYIKMSLFLLLFYYYYCIMLHLYKHIYYYLSVISAIFYFPRSYDQILQNHENEAI